MAAPLRGSQLPRPQRRAGLRRPRLRPRRTALRKRRRRRRSRRPRLAGGRRFKPRRLRRVRGPGLERAPATTTPQKSPIRPRLRSSKSTWPAGILAIPPPTAACRPISTRGPGTTRTTASIRTTRLATTMSLTATRQPAPSTKAPTAGTTTISTAWTTSAERETSPPYPVPLRAVKVVLRTYERDARQIREVSVTHSFVP